MPATKHEELYGWGHAPVAGCESFRPEKRRDLREILARHPASLIARGLGRSYGDASLQPQGTIRTERLDHMIEFDAARGTLRAQAGVSLADVMALCIPKGWMPPVIPGTRHVSLGGAFACNVHGKNHFKHGDFAEHVTSVRLTLAGGETIECTPSLRNNLFWATAGGMGMTGVIEELTLQLKPIPSASLRSTTRRVGNIADMVTAFENNRANADYMVGWIDHMARGKNIGRGIFEAAQHIGPEEGGEPCERYCAPRVKFSVPFFLPPFTLNRYAMALYNRWRFKKYSARAVDEVVGFNGFFHPLDGIANWNRLYGKRGFFQYQCLLPETPDAAEHLRVLLTEIQRRKCFSFLAVLKYHRDGYGYLTFPTRGYSLALDFPNTRRVRALLPEIDRFVADRGGRAYLAKDATLAPELFTQMYGDGAAQWRSLIRQYDPDHRFRSLMSDRLQWKN